VAVRQFYEKAGESEREREREKEREREREGERERKREKGIEGGMAFATLPSRAGEMTDSPQIQDTHPAREMENHCAAADCVLSLVTIVTSQIG
jgi:hypothetical protein